MEIFMQPRDFLEQATQLRTTRLGQVEVPDNDNNNSNDSDTLTVTVTATATAITRVQESVDQSNTQIRISLRNSHT